MRKQLCAVQCSYLQVSLRNRRPTKFENIVSQVSSALYIPPDDSGEEVYTLGAGGDLRVEDTDQGYLETRLRALRLDPGTVTETPEPQEDYQRFLNEFEVDTKKSEISQLLVECTELRTIYTKLVPATLTYREFWARYFFRVSQVEAQEARKAALKRRAEEVAAGREDSLQGWDEDEEEDTPQVEVVAPSPVPPENPPPASPEPATPQEVRETTRGDMVVVKHATSPSDTPTETSDGSGSGSSQAKIEDEWEDDLDVEVTAEDIQQAKELARKMAASGTSATPLANEGDDDWENWE